MKFLFVYTQGSKRRTVCAVMGVGEGLGGVSSVAPQLLSRGPEGFLWFSVAPSFPIFMVQSHALLYDHPSLTRMQLLQMVIRRSLPPVLQ